MEEEQTIVLASGSPRRLELLQNLGLSFIVRPSDVDEDVEDGHNPAKIVEILAERKAAQVAALYPEGIVIGSDTIVVLDNEILGKPRDKEEAFVMLAKLSGKEHSVFSGLAVYHASTGKKRVGYVETKVTMKTLTELEIRQYIATEEPMDKAGSYAIQGLGSLFVTGIQGDYFSVVGLPVKLLGGFLQEFGIDILAIRASQQQ